ncbi:SDR family oxidoreductase [Halocalculus aciditolerans]|uniref:Short-chain dehydrogenase/reductase n=1 Tax=Halocalculus aciditolerans TaxID=1383812 RepID=A0A830FD79_9EURY|nr:SDR family oxidoreductase [Halocalculus aciditolerans]GGL63597.1 short-chain dehydrogenase/reductase [Halocalculus aciditolerans]
MTEETVLITGCSSGIGRATAEAFLDEGWRVVATARNTDDIEGLEEAGCETRELDVTKPAQCVNVVEDVTEAYGLDCLVNNAGFAQFGAAEDLPTRRLHRQFDVNLYGPHRLVRAALPGMREQESGTVVNVSSAAAFFTAPGMGAYSGSKAALESFSDALRTEVAEFGVDVSLVEPGPVETSFGERAQREASDVADDTAYGHVYELYQDYEATFGGMGSEPEDVAAAILEAASSTNPDARYPVGTLAGLARYARLVPDRLRDKLVTAALRFV